VDIAEKVNKKKENNKRLDGISPSLCLISPLLHDGIVAMLQPLLVSFHRSSLSHVSFSPLSIRHKSRILLRSAIVGPAWHPCCLSHVPLRMISSPLILLSLPPSPPHIIRTDQRLPSQPIDGHETIRIAMYSKHRVLLVARENRRINSEMRRVFRRFLFHRRRKQVVPYNQTVVCWYYCIAVICPFPRQR